MKDILDDHRSLMLLREISEGGEPTQRDLSDRLGMAVGLVNTYLKTLVKKGYIKISGIPPKRFKYYLTPKGFMEKSRLTYSLLQNYTRIFKEARREYARLFQALHADGAGGVIFAGVDDMAEIAYLSLQEVGLEFRGAIDDGRRGEMFFGHAIAGFDELHSVADGSRIVITTFNRRDEVYCRLADSGIDVSEVLSIYPLAKR